MDLALNNLQWLICHKTQTTNQPTSLYMVIYRKTVSFYHDSFGWNRNPAHSTSVGYLTHDISSSQRKQRNFYGYIHIYSDRLPECSLYEKSFAFTLMSQAAIQSEKLLALIDFK